WERSEQLLGELQRVLGEIAGMGVEGARLARQRFDDLRVAVAYDRHIVVSVEIAPPTLVVHPHSLSTHELQRLLVEELIGRSQHARTPCQEPGMVSRWSGHNRLPSRDSSAAICNRALMKSAPSGR